MLICGTCGLEKANSHMFRLGETVQKICKSCQSQTLPDAEFEAMRVASLAIEKLQPEAQRRAMQYLRHRFMEVAP